MQQMTINYIFLGQCPPHYLYYFLLYNYHHLHYKVVRLQLLLMLQE